jgi:hypothetical protein
MAFSFSKVASSEAWSHKKPKFGLRGLSASGILWAQLWNAGTGSFTKNAEWNDFEVSLRLSALGWKLRS